MAEVGIAGVRKSYGNVEVIHGIDVEIHDGEFVVLVGPSGCGKSTLLRMIAGLEPITGGTISIGDRVVNGVAPKDRDIAMVFQTYALYPHMTVERNMGFSLRLKGAGKAEVAERVRQAAGILGLEPYLKRYPRQLSGGQRQRVAMGRALVRDPQVFLFDEPLSNLDAQLRVQMRTEIKELHQRLKTTTIFVTHDQVEAMTMADRIVVMRDGHVEQMGTPLELFDVPANTFVATFIGSPAMNMIEGVIEPGDPPVFSGGGVRFDMPATGAVPGSKVTCGIRPEHLELAEEGFAATVSVIEPTGSETLVFTRVGEHTLVALFRERHHFEPGQTLTLRPRPGTLHLFDGRTGQRITETRAAAAPAAAENA
ncbi:MULTISPECIES: sn-glycerol-3-phosphate ABC transporter ATP-binding protein UgpC [unclassified Roseitalea]|uniref:ABC transporter ATP-binding protein n=1 Tax=unclassified Roseitalea TaxID=2639107 RepID=UPI00273D442E|nr:MULTISPECIES: sn-glycerol-3-phosphate ABC transporter ATP-binding protein UgpC [unclassified Roseitalea]